MAVRICDLLETELLKESEVEAGNKGLNNEILRVNFNDCPPDSLTPEDSLNFGFIKKGDLFINSLYLAKEDEDMLYKIIKSYIDSECAGTFIISEYIKRLPLKIVNICNENSFPIVFINPDIPYAEIIKTTMQMILEDKSDTISEMKIEKLLNNDISKKEIVKIANDINKVFKNYYVSLYIKANDINDKKMQLFISNIKKITSLETAKYKDGIFLIINFDILSSLDTYINQIESMINKYSNHRHIGISNIFSEISNFNVCIKQSILSYDISNVIKNTTVHYKDLNVYKILYPLKDTDNLQEFYNEIMKPLIDYDDHFDKFELIKTIEAYLNNDGDYKKTAQYINQHENTVRYRILKAKKILNLEYDNFKFIEQVSLALKIRNILKHSKNK